MAMELVVAFLFPAIDNLYSLLKNEVVSTWGVESDMKKLSSTLSAIYAVLEDAEQKQLKDKAIQNWLKELNDAAYEADDILDEWAFEALRCESAGQGSYSASLKRKLLSCLPTTLLLSCLPTTLLLLCFSQEELNIPFHHNIRNRIKEITDKFDAIAANRRNFILNERVVVERRVEYDGSRETSSFITQGQLYGRDEDRDKIVKFLVEDVCDSEDVSVYPILGIGGLGKTTLAQMAFNDERVKHHFDLKIWVYVSQDFDVKRVIKATIESVDGKACKAVDLDAVQRRLRDKLNGKRYLIVLDDVWDEDQEKWDSLKYLLACGSKGASVIVTTRVDMVASIMGTISPHRLSFLSKEDCWLLFRQRAFGLGNEGPPNLVAIGKEIVKKCGGVPLAAKALGGLMRSKSQEKDWLRVKESEIWNLDQGKIPILPALRLSYFYLPLESRRCFAYCAIFPKGSDIRKRDLIHLWMANGYISCKGGWELEDIGDQICNELCLISFFQEVKKFEADIYFKMHDLVHDLAQSIMKDECAMIEFNSSSNISNEKVRHVTLVVGHGDNFNNTFHKVVTLRTLRLENPTISIEDDEFLCDFRKFGSLRAFEALNKRLTELPSSIGNSKHLRYLNLHCARIKQLPDSICSLLNLQTLILEFCSKLERLPQNMMDLTSLRHLYLLDCWLLIEMPPKIGRLTYLKTLTTFVVGKSTDCSLLAELKCLNLGGELRIEHLERVSNPMDGKEANLVGKQNLSRLQLEWEFGMAEWNSQENVESESESESENVDFEAQENVESESENVDSEDIDSEAQENVESESENVDSEAQENVESESENVDSEDVDSEAQENVESESKNVDSEAQGNVESEAQENVKSEQVLEALQPHPNLKELVVRGYKGTRFPLWMRGPDLQNVVNIELQGCKHCLQLPPLGQLPLLQRLRISRMRVVEYIENEYPGGFPSLEELIVECCPKLESLSREEGRELFPRLRDIKIAYCPKLSLPHLSSPKKLWFLGECTMVLNSVSNLNNLTSLNIVEDEETVCFPKEFLRNLTLLESLSIEDCQKLKVFPEDLASLVTLKSLTIKDCRKLQSLPEEGLRGLESLQSLCIHRCPKIASLPASIQSLTKLQRIQIVSCGRELERRCEKGKGDDWYKIAHVPEVSIKA